MDTYLLGVVASELVAILLCLVRIEEGLREARKDLSKPPEREREQGRERPGEGDHARPGL